MSLGAGQGLAPNLFGGYGGAPGAEGPNSGRSDWTLHEKRESTVNQRKHVVWWALDALVLFGLTIMVGRFVWTVQSLEGSDPVKALAVGSVLPLDADLSGRTLVLLLSPECVACQLGKSDYVDLMVRAKEVDTGILVLAEEEASDVHAWLDLSARLERDVEIVQVESASALGFTLAPTALILSERTVTDLFAGRLEDPADRDAFAARLGPGAEAGPVSNTDYMPELFISELRKMAPYVRLDVRDRDTFNADPNKDARNFPHDEIGRALVEIPRGSRVLVDCTYGPSRGACHAVGRRLRDVGFDEVFVVI